MRYRAHALSYRYAVQSAVLTLLMALALSYAASFEVERVVAASWGKAASVAASTVVKEGLNGASTDAPLSREAYAALDALVRERLLSSGFSKVRVWSTDRLLVYASDGIDVGKRVPGGAEMAPALEGEVAASIVRNADGESAARIAFGTPVLEAYAPLEDPSGRVFGAFEIYAVDPTIAGHMRDTDLAITAIVLLGALLLYFTQLRIVWRAEDTIHVQEHEVEVVNERLRESLKTLEQQTLGTLEGLITAVDAKDSYTARHLLAVTDYAMAAAKHLGLSAGEIAQVEQAGLLHDVGKIGVAESVLLKPSHLDSQERELVREHSEMGARIVESIPVLNDLVGVVRHHHESWDGGGYPGGLSGEEIPLIARLLAVADAFDAMTSDRPYRTGMRIVHARAELLRCRGTQFDPACVDALVAAIDSGELAISRYHLHKGPGVAFARRAALAQA